MRVRRKTGERLPAMSELEGEHIESSSVVASFVVSGAGELLRANKRFTSLLGAQSEKEVIGIPLTKLVPSRRDWEAWRRACLAGTEREVRLAFRGRGGREVLLKGDIARARNGPDGALVGLFVDVSEEEKLSKAVQRGARMEALGSLTSGIAHDFNNLLTVLVGNLYLVAEDLRDDPNVFPKLKAARDAAKRGADLIRQLLAFARRESIEAETVAPAKVVDDLIPLLRRALGSKVTLETRLSPDAGRVRCNAAQLESVMVNLAVNARDAMEESGSISIDAELVHLAAAVAQRHGVSAGAYVKLVVSDDGAGIATDALERVFEPFFTTKTNRGGTGLGLSMVRWFAQQCGGAVYINSAPGKGTSVSLLLPQSAEQEEETSSAKTAPLSTLPGGEENVLVFARDDGLRSMITQILEVLGYRVQIGMNADETASVLRTKAVDLLLVDAAAQHDGARQQLLRAAVNAKPSLKIILTVDAADAARAKPSSGPTQLLGKPFSIADLAGAVRRALDGETRAI